MLIGQRRMGVDLLLADSVSAISPDLTIIYARLKRSLALCLSRAVPMRCNTVLRLMGGYQGCKSLRVCHSQNTHS
jgi:hypothetical protein